MNNANTTVKRPFEMKAERNKEILNNFLSSSTEEYQTMVNALLAFWNGDVNRTTGTIKVSIGQTTDKGFNAMLMSFTDSPNVVIGNWDNTEPTICIGVNNRKIHNMICSLNLTLIDDISVDKVSNNKYIIEFKYNGAIDYKLEIVHND